MRALLFATALAAALPDAALALNPVTWAIDEVVYPTDTLVTWTSPTPVDIGLANYEYDYTVTEARVYFNPFGSASVLDELGDAQSGSGLGQLPAELIDESLSGYYFGATVSADLFVEVGGDGYARATVSNISLPGLVNRVALKATISVTGYDYGDYNLDGSVDAIDYSVWRSAYALSGTDILPDGNFDGRVDAADYAVWRNHTTGGAPLAALPAPEPSSLWLALNGLVVLRRL